MACALTQGFSINDCRESIGGASELRIIEKANITSMTIGAGGVITAITLASGKKFWKYSFKRNNLMAESQGVVSFENETVVFDQKIECNINKLSSTKRDELKLVAMNDIVAIVKDNNGNYMLYGKDYGLTMAAKASTGKALVDFNGYNVSFTGQETNDAYFVDSTIIAGITN